MMVTGLPPTGSWQDLKDHMRDAGDVCYSDVFKDGSGVVEYLRREDMKYALKKLDDTKFKSHEVRFDPLKFRNILMFSLSRERHPTFAARRTMEAGARGGLGPDPGAGRGPTRDPGPRLPTLLSGEGTGPETGTGAETGVETAAWSEAETVAWIVARTRAGAGVGAAPGQTLELAESPDQGRGKSPGRDRDPPDRGLDPREGGGGGRICVPLITVPG